MVVASWWVVVGGWGWLQRLWLVGGQLYMLIGGCGWL